MKGPKAVQGTQADDEQVFYVEWAREIFKANIPTVTDSLQRLVTLNCALLGGSLTLYDEKVLPFYLHPYVVMSFFLALVSSVIGMLPITKDVDPNDPKDIRDKQQQTLAFKRSALNIAFGFLVLGFGFCIYGMLATFYFGPAKH